MGRLLPNISLKITHPETHQALPSTETGVIHFKGPNIFKGYFHDEEATKTCLQDDWLETGDIGRLDGDGFLYIEGRLKRFSKINGEMVSHEAVQEALVETLAPTESVEIAVTARQKASEKLVLIWGKGDTQVNAPDLSQVRKALSQAHYPPSFAIASIVEVDTLPRLGNGKLDLKGLDALAGET